MLFERQMLTGTWLNVVKVIQSNFSQLGLLLDWLRPPGDWLLCIIICLKANDLLVSKFKSFKFGRLFTPLAWLAAVTCCLSMSFVRGFIIGGAILSAVVDRMSANGSVCWLPGRCRLAWGPVYVCWWLGALTLLPGRCRLAWGPVYVCLSACRKDGLDPLYMELCVERAMGKPDWVEPAGLKLANGKPGRVEPGRGKLGWLEPGGGKPLELKPPVFCGVKPPTLLKLVVLKPPDVSYIEAGRLLGLM